MSQAIQGVPIPTGGNGQFISEWIKSLLSLGTLFMLKQYTYHLCAIALFLSHSIAFSAFATPTKINGLFTIISPHNKQIQILKCINMNYLVLSLFTYVKAILTVKYILSFLCTCLCLRLRYAYSYA